MFVFFGASYCKGLCGLYVNLLFWSALNFVITEMLILPYFTFVLFGTSWCYSRKLRLLHFQIKFEEGVIGTPQLTDSIELPESVELLGQKIDLNPVKGLLTSVQDTASSVAKSISSRPPLKFSLSNRNAESWLLTTYLDDELRISRGDGGSIFVLIKEGSPLLKP